MNKPMISSNENGIRVRKKIVDEWRDYNYAIFPFSQSPESLPLSIKRRNAMDSSFLEI